MSDGLSDGSSLVTIEDYSNEVIARVSSRGGAEFFAGNRFLFRARSVSQLQVDDRIVSGAGHVHVCSNSKKVYKALSIAIDAKMFRFIGVFNCANQYLLRGDGYPEQGVLVADRPVPYCFHDESPLRGAITFDEVLPTPNGRHIVIVNVDNQGPTLTNTISSGTIIYLGGTHDESVVQSKKSSSVHFCSAEEDELLFPVLSGPLELGPGASDDRIVISSSPWKRTYGGGNCGRNVGLAKLKNGNFLYWGTDCSPSAGCQLSPLPLSEIPLEFFPKESGWSPSLREPTAVLFPETFEGAWVMRGARLVQVVDEGLYPSGVLERLRGGFDRLSNITCNFSAFRVYNRVNKVLRLLEVTKGNLEGFRLVANGKYECTADTFSTVSRVSTYALGSFISSCGLSDNCFFDIPFAARAMQGSVKLVGGIPTGNWMVGRLIATSAGLLYCAFNDSYHSVENVNGISYVSPYIGEGISAAKNLNLAPLIQ